MPEPDAPEPADELTVERITATIKELAEKRDKINETIAALKKKSKKMINSL